MKNYVRNFVSIALYSIADRLNTRSAQPADFRASGPAAFTQPGLPASAKAATNGDYLRANLPEPIDPRSRWGQVIKEVTSNGMCARYIFVCDRCGTNNFIATIHSDRKVPCIGGCGREFSIASLRDEAIKRARATANQQRGSNIPLDRKFTNEEIDNWYYTLPELCPSTETSPREAARKRIEEQLNDPKAGEVEWVGTPQIESLDSGLAFADPASGSWRH
jgi:hypothetical protein